MTEKELFNKNIFIDLFKMNDIEKAEREDNLLIEARNLVLKKDLKKV